MDISSINNHCASLVGAVLNHPFGEGHDVWKVGGKIFAICSATVGGFSIKTPSIEDAALLIEAGVAVRAPYLHRSWVMITWGLMEQAEAEARITRSYAIIVAALPKKMRPIAK